VQNQLAADAATARPWWMIPLGLVMFFGVLYVLKVVADRALASLMKAGPTAGA